MNKIFYKVLEYMRSLKTTIFIIVSHVFELRDFVFVSCMLGNESFKSMKSIYIRSYHYYANMEEVLLENSK